MSATPMKLAFRFGYGPSPLHPLPGSTEEVTALLSQTDASTDAFPSLTFARHWSDLRRYRQIRKEARASDDPALQERLRQQNRVRLAGYADALRARLARAAAAPMPLHQRLTAFWADHFTVNPSAHVFRPGVPGYIDEAIRPNILGPFATLLKSAALHPAMVISLDQHLSVGPNSQLGQRSNRGLNENLAREVLELHTLGVGGSYTQSDVRQFAELLTGVSIDTEGFKFKRHFAEPGAELVLGKSYGGDSPNLRDVQAFLEDVAVHPDTAAHIARKLAVHFVSNSPDPQLVAHLRRTFLATDGDLRKVTQALILHPAAFRQFGEKIRQPQDFVLAGIRALGIDPRALATLGRGALAEVLISPLRAMRQPFDDPPGPDGWPEEESAWLTPQGLAGRINWAMTAPRTLTDDLPDPREFVRTASGDLAGSRTRFAASAAATRWEGIGVVLASPEFNRR